jgi:parvulin-like peptidyl-prolyl isomerase
MTNPTRFRFLRIAGATVAIGTLAAFAWFGLDLLRAAAATETRHSLQQPEQSGSRVVAMVDGAAVAESELQPFLNAGLDKAIAIDRAINKAVAANSADRLYSQQSRSAMQSAKNEILASLYISQRSTELRNAVTEADIKAFYQSRVKDEDFTAFRLKFFVSVDAREAQALFDGLGRGDKDALARLAYVKKDADHLLSAAEVPYGLGQAVKKLKAGERLQPVVVREGVLVLYVDDVKTNPKPELDKVQAEIKELIVSERFNADLKARRAAAKIELRG